MRQPKLVCNMGRIQRPTKILYFSLKHPYPHLAWTFSKNGLGADVRISQVVFEMGPSSDSDQHLDAADTPAAGFKSDTFYNRKPTELQLHAYAHLKLHIATDTI